ncbi:MAG: integrase/recombinase XerC [Sphingobacteriales bacterium]|jgi:integrase/recombinase XerC
MINKSFFTFLEFEKRYSLHTIKAYESDLKQFSDFSGEVFEVSSFVEVTHSIVRSWIVSLMDQDVAARSIHRKISTLQSYFNFLIREKQVEKNPMTKVQRPKVGRKLPSFVEEEQLNNLFDNDLFPADFEGVRNRVLIELLYGTGMRRAEVCGLKEMDFDLSGSTVRVLGKRNKQRIVPLHIELVNQIKKYLIEKKSLFSSNNKDEFFVTLRNQPIYPELVYRVVQKYLSLVTTSKKRSPHVLRHTFATHLLNKGADLNAIKELLGHSSLAATQVYTHNTIDKLKSIYNQAHPRA